MTDEKTNVVEFAKTDLRAACNMVIERSAAMMVEELGAPIEIMLDRMLTYAGAQACVQQGSPAAAIAPATIPGAKHHAGNLPGVLTRSKASR